MKRFKTLLWLEYRRSRVWAAALIGSLAFWAWGMHQVRLAEIGERLGVRAGLLTGAALIGVLVLCLMIGRIRGETRQGQYQVLLLSPPSGYLHVLARFAFALITALVYAVIIGGLAWWAVSQAGVILTAGSVGDILFSVPLYLVGTTVAPLLAWTLLLMVFISAYRVSGPGWVPGVVMVLGTPFLFRWIGEWIVRISYTLPGWRMLNTFGIQMAHSEEATSMAHSEEIQFLILNGEYIGVPQEPLWIMLAITVVMLLIAGRIWEEVEG